MTVNFSSPTFPFHLPKLFGKECQLSAQPIQGYKLPASEIEIKKEKEKKNTTVTQNTLKPLLEMKLGFILSFG